ncbi:PREDICTED: uncharacterized protein PFB0765w-like [Polistes dominula]|uniref:Uncharacterized protein PFB0765w-like n=1 Tax=Polistes dominula TaxID=743375 RepID=A0ABM1JDJ3_POLDO|nr:PREDICTED: uncharacterized protein PFB0765w-like [Polistes dominula]
MAKLGVCPCGCNVLQSHCILHSPSEPCCCCSYDPFNDNSKESEIRDLSFALKKLAVMRCQTKKWRMERLQLESETRSLKQALQSFGVDTNVALKSDPMIVHYRQENERLQNANEELEEKLKDLEESLAERECWEDPEEEVIHVREKMKTLKERFLAEKKEFKEMISKLRLKLAEAEDDTSCAALNHLRMKLRELMKNGEEADRQVADVVEKSMDTMLDLSKGCEKLKLDNERLRRLLEDLGMSSEEIDEYLKNLSSDPMVYKINNDNDVEAIQESPQNKLLNLEKKLNDCYESMKVMKDQLDEKNATLELLRKELDTEKSFSLALASDLDKISVSYKTLMEEVVASKEELQRKDKKIYDLTSELRQSTISLQDMNKLQKEIEDVKPQLYDLEIERDNLLEELVKIREIVSERNDQIIKILESKEKLEQDYMTKLGDLQEKLDAKLLEETSLKKYIDDLQNELTRFRDLTQDLEEQRALNEKSLKIIKDLEDELASLRNNLKNLEDEKNDIISKLDAMQIEADELKKRLAEEEKLKNDLNDKLDAVETEMENLRNENFNFNEQLKELHMEKDDKEKAVEEVKRLESELASTKAQKEKAEKDNVMLREELAKLDEKNDKLMGENESLRRKIEEFDGVLEALNKCKEENNSLRGRINELESINNASKEESERAKADAEKIKNESIAVKDALDKMIEKLDKLKDENERLKMQNDENARLKPELEKLRSANMTLRNESDILKAKLDDTLAELDVEKLARSNAEKELMTLKNELKNLLVKIDELKKENEALKEEKEELKKTLLKFGDDLSNVKNENLELIKEMETLKARIVNLEDQTSKLEEEIEHWKMENCKTGLSVDKLKADLEKALKESVECQVMVLIIVSKKLLEQQVSQLEQDNLKLEKQKEDILYQLDHLGKSHELDKSLKEEALKDLNVMKDENISLKDELSALKAELLRLREENKDLKSSLANTLQRLTSADSEIEKQKAEILALRTENTSMKGEVERLKDKTEKFSREAAKLETDLASLQSENDNLKVGQQKLQEDYGKLRGQGDGQLIEIDKLKSELAAERSNVDKLKTELSSCQKENVEIMEELRKLREENEKLKNQLEDDQKMLSDTTNKLKNIEEKVSKTEEEKISLLDELTNLRARIDKLEKQLNTEKDIKGAAIRDCNSCKEELAALKEELARIRVETGRLEAETDKLKIQMDDANKLVVSLRKKEEDLKSDGERSRKSLEHAESKIGSMEKKISDLSAEKSKMDKMIEELQHQKDLFATRIDGLKRDLAECNKMRDASLKEIETLRELEKALDWCQEDREKLRLENESLKKDISKTRTDLQELDTNYRQLKTKMTDDSEASKKEIDRLKLENIESKLQLDDIKKANFGLRKLLPVPGEDKSTVSDDNDFIIEVIEALMKKIKQQNDGLSRVRDYVMFLTGKIEEKPKMASAFEEDDDFVRRLISPFDKLLLIFHELSNNIYRVEIEIQELDDLRKSMREEDKNLKKKFMEEDISEDKEALDSFDSDVWLKSLTLTQMADLHDKICLLTSSMVRDDSDKPSIDTVFTVPCPGRSPSQEDYDILNKRIAALQRQIAEKQMEASWKLQELKRALSFEQANLIRISDEMNLERKRNLALQLTMDNS